MPSDFLAPFSLAVISSDVYYYLLLKQVSFMRSYKPTTSGSVTGRPKYYAEFNSSSFILAPTHDATYTFEDLTRVLAEGSIGTAFSIFLVLSR